MIVLPYTIDANYKKIKTHVFLLIFPLTNQIEHLLQFINLYVSGLGIPLSFYFQMENFTFVKQEIFELKFLKK
jgi:hypothetical protein